MVFMMMISDLSESHGLSFYGFTENSLSISVRISFHPLCFINESWLFGMCPCITIFSVPVWRKLFVHLNGGNGSDKDT